MHKLTFIHLALQKQIIHFADTTVIVVVSVSLHCLPFIIQSADQSSFELWVCFGRCF